MTYSDAFRQELAADIDDVFEDLQADGVHFAKHRVAIRTYTVASADEGKHKAGTATIADHEPARRPTVAATGLAGSRNLVNAMLMSAGIVQEGDVTISGISIVQVTRAEMNNLQAYRPSAAKTYVWWVSQEQDWVASTAYALGDRVIPAAHNGHAYVCTTAGTSGASAPTWPTTQGATVTDGTAVWTEAGADGVEYQQINFSELGLAYEAEARRITEHVQG